MSAHRLSLRLARREVLRRPGRTALVALLVAIPVMGMVLALVLLRTGTHPLDEQWAQEFGSADAVLTGGGTLRNAPEGTDAVPVTRSGGIRVLTEAGHRATMDVEDLDPTEPLAAGRVELASGRAPAAPGEIALTREALAKLDVAVGDELALARPEGTYEVVGEVAYAECFRCPRAVVAPGSLGQLTGDGQAAVPFDGESRTLLDLPTMDAAATAAFEATAQSQSLMLHDRFVEGYYQDAEKVAASSISWTLVIGALVLTVVGIVISAAFAVGARRQLVTIGQLSASGAPPASVRSALLLQGTVTGAAGSVLGIVLAVAVLLGLRHQVEYVLDQPIEHYRFSVPEILIAALIGVAAATVAALIPARSAAGVPTLAALAGRRPLPPVSRGLVVKGLIAVVVGLGLFGLAILGGQGTRAADGQIWAYVAVLGGVTEVLGACALAPAVVARLEPLAHRLRGGLRLGARSLARQRARTGAVVSAVCAAGALAVAVGAAVLGSSLFRDSIDQRMPDDVVIASEQLDRYDNTTKPEDTLPKTPSADVLDQLHVALPDAEESPYRVVLMPADFDSRSWTVREAGTTGPTKANDKFSETGFTLDVPVIGDDATLDAARVPAAARRALEDHGAVIVGPGISGTAVVTDTSGTDLTVPIVSSPYTLGFGPTLFLSPAEAERRDIPIATQGLILHNPTRLTDGEIDALEDIQYFTGGAGDPAAPEVNRYIDLRRSYRDNGPTKAQLELLLGGLALVFALFVVGVSLALAAAESKDERDILTIAGAPPSIVARSAGARAWLMASIGAVMAVPVGFLPIVVVHLTSDTGGYVSSQFPLVFPSRTVALLVIVVPAIVAVVAYGSSATAQRLRPVRISTATFE